MTAPAALLRHAQALIVDWDGTVVDNTGIRRAAALAPYGIPVPAERYRALAGLPVREVIARLAANSALSQPPAQDVVVRSRAALLASPAPPSPAPSSCCTSPATSAFRWPSPPAPPRSPSTTASSDSSCERCCRWS
ncbi:hypothetical protein [Kitasatospora sp. DSM 101779]|uniref:hypothetical protein n=1 Tax=Kitasatospora sp. DSM 101779 TaxID=2853165 RepID=UPI0021D94627|nr:hypothetical protein [Kitasatospora sp. DSM 101779]